MRFWRSATRAVQLYPEGDFNLAEEAAEIIRVLTGPRVIPTSDELEGQ
jgi:hypothetical protein